MRVVRVHRTDVDRTLGLLLDADVVERSLKVARRGDHALIPLRGEPPEGLLEGIDHDLGDVAMEDLAPREALRTPYDRVVRAAMDAGWSEEDAGLLPDRWERLGRLVLLRVPPGSQT